MYYKPNISILQSDWPNDYGCDGPEIEKKFYVGDHIDRFGKETGFFFGVPGEPYIYRSLPWFGIYDPNDDNYNQIMKENFYHFYSEGDTDINPEYDYHLYKVLKPFEVNECKIRAAFGFPGGGTQFRSNTKVKDLIKRRYIQEVPWFHTPFYDDEDIDKASGVRSKRKTKKNIKRKSKTKKRNSKK